MFCPGCGAEYREGFTRCADCDLVLVEEKDLPPGLGPEGRTDDDEGNDRADDSDDSDEIDDSDDSARGEETGARGETPWNHGDPCPPDAIQVFESTDPFIIKAVVSLLDENHVPFYLQNGDLGGESFSPIFGGSCPHCLEPARFLVLPDQEATVRPLLADFQALPPGGGRTFVDLPPELAEATDEPDSEEDDEEPVEEEVKELFCPLCGAELELSEAERRAGTFSCPTCGKRIEFD